MRWARAACPTLLTIAALAVRVRLLPGVWNADAIYYGRMLAEGATGGTASSRDFRRLFLGLAAAGRALVGDLPLGASLPGLVLGTAAVPLTWLAARRRLGDFAALAPAALVGFVPVAVEESSRPSADAALLAFGAALLWLLDRSTETRGRGAFVAVGLCAGLGIVFKETFLLVALPACAWLASAAWRRRAPWSGVVLVVLVAATIVFADHWTSAHAGGPGRLEVADRTMAALRTVSADAAPRRFGFGPLPGCFTDAFRWGGFFLVLAAASACALTGSAAASPAAWLAVGGLLCAWFMPVSLHAYAVLPTGRERYLLGSLPALATLPFLAFADVSPAAWRRVVAAIAALPPLVLARHDPAMEAAVIVGVAAVLAPERFRRAAPWALGAAALCALVPRSDGLVGVARWTFVAPAVAAVVRPDAASLRGAAFAACVAACAVAADAAAAPVRADVAALRALPSSLAGARRVFATSYFRRWLIVATADGARIEAAIWTDEDAAAGRLPPAAAAGDVCVLESRVKPPAAADVVVEKRGPAAIVRVR